MPSYIFRVSRLTAFIVLGGWIGGSLDARAQSPAPEPSAKDSQPAALAPQGDELDRLEKEGREAYQKGDFEGATKAWQTELEKAEALGKKEETARSLNNLGIVSLQRSQYDKALDYHTRALKLREALGNKQDIASSLNNLGSVHFAQSQFDKALDYRTRALALIETLGNKQDIALTLNNLGSLYGALGQFDKAIESHTRALAIREALGNKQDIATSLGNLGVIYIQLGQLDKALDYNTRALKLREALGNKQDIAISLSGLGSIYYAQGQFDQALDHFTRALSLLEALGNPQYVTASLINLGAIYSQLGQFDRALDYNTRALPLLEALGNPQSLATALNNLGILSTQLGQYEKALEYYARALPLLETLGNQQNVATGLNNLGSVYSSLGQLDKALDHHSRALTLMEAIGNKQNIATGLDNLGGVYVQLGQLDTALDYRTRALTLRETLGNKRDIAISLNNLGSIYTRLNQLDKALEYRARALSLLESLGNKQETAAGLNNLGGVYYSLGQWDKAQEHYARALAMREALGNQQDIAASLNNLGSLYGSQGQYEKALDFHTRALALLEAIGNKGNMAISLSNLGTVYQQQGKLEKAEAAFARAVAYSEAMSEQVANPSQVSAFQDALQPNLYGHYAALLLKLDRASDALAMAERGRAQGLARQVAQTHADLARFLSPEEATQLHDRTRELTVAGHLLRAALSQTERSNPSQLESAKRRLSEAKTRYAEADRRWTLLQDGLSSRYPAYRRAQGRQPSTAADLAALAQSHPDTLFMEWIGVDDKTTLLFALSKAEGVRPFTLPFGAAALKTAVAQWRNALINALPSESEKAQALYAMLLGPVEKAGLLKPGSYRRLSLVPDGPLHDLPFAALRDETGKRLIERYPLSTTVSLGALTWPSPSRPSTRSLLLAVDPADAPVEKIATALRSGFAPLKHAQEEARKVAGLVPRSRILVGPAMREGALKQEIGPFALLHFATHGVLDSQAGLRSWLLLAAEPTGSSEDGRLEAREIVGLPLSARLAVLSACETGRGQASGGEGLLGLAWAFQAAGCRSVVASQWKVDDEATGRLMTRMYEGLRAGRRKDEALQSAMLALRKEKVQGREFGNPFYWAGFEVIGDTSALPASLFTEQGRD